MWFEQEILFVTRKGLVQINQIISTLSEWDVKKASRYTNKHKCKDTIETSAQLLKQK
jgi:hypothetical protein